MNYRKLRNYVGITAFSLGIVGGIGLTYEQEHSGIEYLTPLILGALIVPKERSRKKTKYTSGDKL
jgi:hypothetical protein